MVKPKKLWKSARGKLGMFAPLMGNWYAEAHTPLGLAKCTRSFTPILKGAYIQLTVCWEMEKGNYEELAILGANATGEIVFWSFTSDKKNSQGKLADVTDVHPEAIGFVAEMPAGLARMVYWPDDTDGYYWAVESRTQRGWNRFTEHHYRPIH